MALHYTRVSIEHGHAFVEVAIGEVGFVGIRVNEDLGYPPIILEVVAAASVAGVCTGAADKARIRQTKLLQEGAVLGELQHVGVSATVPTDPHVLHMIDEDPVV